MAIWSPSSGGSEFPSTPPSSASPSTNGLLAWAFDPAIAAGSTTIAVGNILLTQVTIPTALTASNLWFRLVTVGNTLTAGENFVGLYSAAGSLLQSAVADSAFVASSGSDQSLAITPTALSAGIAYIAFLANGTTGPTLARASAQNVNTGLGSGATTIGTTRAAQVTGGGKTALQATLGALSASTAQLWAGIS